MNPVSISTLGSHAPLPARLPGLLAALGGLYASQGLLGGLVHEGLPVLMRSQGVGLDRISLLSLLFLPTTLKFLWAARIDRLTRNDPTLRLRCATRLQLCLLGGLLLLSALAWQHALPVIFGLLLLMTLLVVTQDILADGLAVQTLRAGQRNQGNALQIGGSYLGYILGGGVWVVIVHQAGWLTGMVFLAGLLAVCTLPALWLRRRALPAGAAPSPASVNGHLPSLRTAWQRPALRWGMATVLACQASVRSFTAIMLTYLIDRGLDASQVGLLSGTGVAVAGITGAALGSMLLRRFGRPAMLKACLWAALALQLAYLGVESQGWQAPPLLAGLFLLFCLSMAMGFVVLYTLMMDWASPAQPGTDYSLLQCTDALCAVLLGLGTGLLAHHAGYLACFMASSALALIGLLCAPWLCRRASQDLAIHPPPERRPGMLLDTRGFTVHDVTDFPVCLIAPQVIVPGYSSQWLKEIQALLAHREPFVLIYLEPGDDEPHEDRKVRATWLKTHKQALAGLCVSLISVLADAQRRAHFDAMGEAGRQAFGIRYETAATLQDARTLALQRLQAHSAHQ